MRWFVVAAMTMPPDGFGPYGNTPVYRTPPEESTLPIPGKGGPPRRGSLPPRSSPGGRRGQFAPNLSMGPRPISRPIPPSLYIPPDDPPPDFRTTSLRRRAIALGALCAVLLVLAGGVGIALASGHGGGLANVFGGKPTTSSTATTLGTPGTTTGTPGANGFSTYTAASGLWSLSAPPTATITTGALVFQNVTSPSTAFTFGQDGAMLAVYEVPTAFSPDQAQTIFNGLVQTLGATNVVILQQPTADVIGPTTWFQVIITATVQGLAVRVSVLYTPHGQGAVAISTQAPAASYATDDSQAFTPMVQSFTFLR